MRHLLFFLALIVFAQHRAVAQSEALNQVAIRSETPDTSRILALAESAYQLQNTNPDEALKLADRADSLSQILQYSKGRGRANRVLGNVCAIKGDHSRALELFELALSFSQDANDIENASKCYGNIGFICGVQGNYERALACHFQSVKLNEYVGNRRGVAFAYNNIAYVYEALGNNAKALEYLGHSLAILEEIGDQGAAAVSLLNIGVMHFKDKKYDTALNFQLKALELLELVGDKTGLASAYASLADLFIATGDLEKVPAYLEKGLRAAQEINAPHFVGLIKESYAKYYYAKNDFTSSLRYASDAQKIAKQSGSMECMRDAAMQVFQAASKLGLHKQALESYQSFIALRDSMKNEKVHKRLLALEYALKDEKIRAEQERKDLEHQAERERQRRTAVTAAIILFSLLAATLYGLYRVWKDKARQAVVRMREKVSRDLHDSMGSNLSTINILSNVVMQELSHPQSQLKLKEILDKISSLSTDAMESVDDIVWSLNPRHDSFDEVVARMRLLGGQIFEGQGVNFMFYVYGDPAKCNLDIERRSDFYLIYKEAVTNISKYAKCRNVYLGLTVRSDFVELVIADDGVGFCNDTLGSGHGLQNIKARSANLNAKLTIHSEINKGTRVQLTVPVQSYSVA
jgi:two-component system, NarL family, sensor histidine kinase UhpB